MDFLEPRAIQGKLDPKEIWESRGLKVLWVLREKKVYLGCEVYLEREDPKGEKDVPDFQD